MARAKRATIFRRGDTWWVAHWKDGDRVRESTGTENRKLAEEVRRAREREMLLGTSELQHEVVRALNDPARRVAILSALEPAPRVEVTRALSEYMTYSAAFKRPKTVAADRGRL